MTLFAELQSQVPHMTGDALETQLTCMTKAQLLEFAADVWQFTPVRKSATKATIIDALLTIHRTTTYAVAPRIVIVDAAEMTDEIAEAATWETSRGCEKCGAGCRNLSAINGSDAVYYIRCESCGDVQAYDKPAPKAPTSALPVFVVGDAVTVKHTPYTGSVTKLYSEKLAVEIGGVEYDFYPADLALLNVPPLVTIPATPSAPAPLPCRTPGCPNHGLYADGSDANGTPLNICARCRNERNAAALRDTIEFDDSDQGDGDTLDAALLEPGTAADTDECDRHIGALSSLLLTLTQRRVFLERLRLRWFQRRNALHATPQPVTLIRQFSDTPTPETLEMMRAAHDLGLRLATTNRRASDR